MGKTTRTTRKRVNITLTQDTLDLLDRVAAKGDRSQLIDQAVRSYVSNQSRASLKWLLKEGAEVRAERDLELAREWHDLEHEVRPRGTRKK